MAKDRVLIYTKHMHVVVDGLLIRYKRTGTGRLVLLLHGWGDTADGLSALQSGLSKNFEVIALDLPGFGGSDAPSDTWGLDDYAALVGNFCAKIDETPYAIVGHSNGGAVAIRGLNKQLCGADKLVLLASAGVRGTYKGRVRALRTVTKLGKAMTAPLPRSVKRKLRRSVYQAVGSDMLVAEHLQETFKKVVTDDVRADAAQIRQDTLLIYGDQDTATPVSWGQMLHKAINKSRMEVIPGAGHFVHVDAPDNVLGLVREFLK